MSLNQLLETPQTPCLPWKKIKVYDLTACNEVLAPDGIFDNVDTTTINGQPYPPSLPLPSPLIANKVLRTNAAANAVLWGDVPHGTTRQLLQTNTAATSSEWTSDVSVNDLNVNGNMTFNNAAAAIGAVLTRTTLTDQAWQTPTPVKLIRFAGYFGAQDLNISAGPNPVVFDIVSSISNIASTTFGSITGITQPSATTFQTGTTGTYDIAILGYIDPTSTGIGNSDITLSIEVGGTELANACVCNSTSHNFSGTFPSVVIPAATNVRVIVRRVTGTNPLNTFASGTAVPSYSSTISFSLVNTL